MVLLGEIDLFTGVERACGNALGLTRGLHAHSASGRGVRVAVARKLSNKSGSREALQWRSPFNGSPETGCASQGCSRVRREIQSGRTGRIALSSECSLSIRRLHVSSHGIALLS
jgi:hypothetical protein